MRRPPSIINFERSFWASTLTGVASFALHWPTMMEALKSDPRLSSSVDGAAIGVALAIGFSLALSLLLWYLISRRASNITKWIYVVVMGFGVIAAFTSINDPMPSTGFALAISLAGTALTALSIYFLFRPDARAWFAKETIDQKVFD
ncbi:hypothetical protein [Sphingopyxis sp.]|uniref:hypothetical protein n=1 Tax=Sphingopyxis sp. TaxID=1908224 RepID=UPI001D208FFD|nr:hypothetical protein [Sphingopyxis sp.]MBW8294654.1 hypothetical protein [Sphingopyxis sp.]